MSKPTELQDDNPNRLGPRVGVQESLIHLSDVLGRKWHLVILYHLMNEGSLRFSEIQEQIDGVSDKVLSESLASLSDHGLVDRRIAKERPLNVQYTTTEEGEALRPVVEIAEKDALELT